MKLLLLIPLLTFCLPAISDTHCGTGPGSIPDGSGALTWTIEVPETAVITTKVLLMTRITHPWMGDLSLRLTAPDGTTALLLDRPGMPDGGWIGPWGCGGDDAVCLFDDEAAEAAESTCSLDAVPVLNGNLSPLESLSVFNGLDPTGTWLVQVIDHSPIDAGTVDQLCLTFTSSPDCNGNGVPDSQDIDGGGSQDADGNGVPDECQCLGDADGDLVVDVSDLLLVLDEWGCMSNCEGDLNSDSAVDVSDLLMVISAWGPCR